MTPEGQVLRSILDYLCVMHIWHMRMNTGAIKTESRFFRFGTPGCADILASVDGRFVWLEVKAAKGKQSQAQKDFQAKVEEQVHTYAVVHSIDEVKAVLEGLK